MKVVMTLVARDEADIVDAVVAFHLAAGVDHVIATDPRSEDGTTEILERYERHGVLHLIRETEREFRQDELMTRMARMAATDFGADWVINADADEFWWPHAGSWKELFDSIPGRFTALRGGARHFAPSEGEDRYFAERMTRRVRSAGRRRDDPFHPSPRVAHRAHTEVVVETGNHDVSHPGYTVLRGWYPFEVLHFPLRSVAQSRRKILYRTAEGLPASGVAPHVMSASKLIRAGVWERSVHDLVAGDDVAPSSEAGCVSRLDTRLRDALRRLAGVPELPAIPRFAVPQAGARLELARPTIAEFADYLDDMRDLQALEEDVRFEQRLRGLERRVADVNRSLGARLLARARQATRTSV